MPGIHTSLAAASQLDELAKNGVNNCQARIILLQFCAPPAAAAAADQQSKAGLSWAHHPRGHHPVRGAYFESLPCPSSSSSFWIESNIYLVCLFIAFHLLMFILDSIAHSTVKPFRLEGELWRWSCAWSTEHHLPLALLLTQINLHNDDGQKDSNVASSSKLSFSSSKKRVNVTTEKKLVEHTDSRVLNN